MNVKSFAYYIIVYIDTYIYAIPITNNDTIILLLSFVSVNDQYPSAALPDVTVQTIVVYICVTCSTIYYHISISVLAGGCCCALSTTTVVWLVWVIAPGRNAIHTYVFTHTYIYYIIIYLYIFVHIISLRPPSPIGPPAAKLSELHV